MLYELMEAQAGRWRRINGSIWSRWCEREPSCERRVG